MIQKRSHRSLLDHLTLFFATGFYTGLIPGLPGTCGTLLAMALLATYVKIMSSYSYIPFHFFYLVFVALWVPFSILIAHQGEKLFQKKDSQQIVIDEMSGYFLSLVFLPLEFRLMLLAFLFFRFFDILKPFPIRKIESRLSGGFGVVLDDLLAGVFTHLCLKVFLIFETNFI